MRYLGDRSQRVTPEGRACLPPDFDFRFLQAAQPDLQQPGFFEGNEELVLLGLLPEERMQTHLPRLKPVAEIRFADGSLTYVSPALDTVHVDLDSHQVSLCWRCAFPATHPVRRVSVETSKIPA
jgi:hypothetical protein